jgi:carbon-monoxide dehydrogenase small subunit
MKQIINLDINGELRELAVEPGDTLLRTLRDRVGLLGTKRGCDSGGCGCCTVLVDGKAVYSCMTFVHAVRGRRITTVEGLAIGGRLDPIQDAFIKAGAVQCGYCTCGMMLAAKQLLTEKRNPGEDDIRHAIAGNLCRCTGYRKIIQAIQMAAAAKQAP